jgi:predicted DCC family thiol-disulfide oxidoreductase YuxK
MNLILYDGVCGLCDRFVRFVLTRDKVESFRFRALQDPSSCALLGRFGRDPADLDTVYVVVGYDGSAPELRMRGEAVLFVLKELGWPWKAAAGVLSALPQVLLDAAYDRLAARRYKTFGRAAVCYKPPSGYRDRFPDP